MLDQPGNSSLIDSRPKSPDVFISYASADLERAAALHARLTAEKFVVWFDKARLVPGYDWHKEIAAGCSASRSVLPLLTPRWQKSEWTRYETYGSASIVPIIAEGTPEEVLTPPLQRWQALFFDPANATEAQWRLLLDAIRTKLAEPVTERLPHLMELPYPSNPFFTGRDVDLVRIHEELHEVPVAALTQRRVRALAAMGGVGKTTLANEYARRFWRLYSQILWVDAHAGLERSFARLFDKLFPQHGELNLAEKAKVVLDELSGPAERLLVIDNVEDAASVKPWLPREATTGCRTLITSRFAEWPSAEGIRAIALDVLTPESARHFLVNRTGRAAEGNELRACYALAKALGHLPLALEQAGAYIAAPGSGVGFADYLRLFEGAAADLLTRKALGNTEYPDAVIATWQTTAAKLHPESRAILRLCAWYADTPIPRALIIDGAAEILTLTEQFAVVAPLAGPVAADLRMHDALVGLARYSMVLDANDDSFRIHRLVQTVERLQSLELSATTQIIEAASKLLMMQGIEGRTIYLNLSRKQKLYPHCKALWDNAKALSLQTSIPVGLLDGLAKLSVLSGDVEAGSRYSSYGLALAFDQLGESDEQTLILMHEAAMTASAKGEYQRSEALFRKCLQLKIKKYSWRHTETIATAATFANMLKKRKAEGDLHEAAELIEKSVPVAEELLGKEHPDTLAERLIMAFTYRELGRCQEAKKIFADVVGVTDRPENLDDCAYLRVVARGGLAATYFSLGEIEQAIAISEDAIERGITALGRDHPETITAMNNLQTYLAQRA